MFDKKVLRNGNKILGCLYLHSKLHWHMKPIIVSSADGSSCYKAIHVSGVYSYFKLYSFCFYSPISNLVLLDDYFSTIWMATLIREVMVVPVLWTLSKDSLLIQACLFWEVPHPRNWTPLSKRCILSSDNMRCRKHFLAFCPCEWKEATWYAEYPAKDFNWKVGQKPYGTAWRLPKI